VDDANKVWFLANGDKKVGPLSAARIVERIATGKVPSHARAWREGMIEWKAVSEIEEFQVLPTIVPGATDGTLAATLRAAKPTKSSKASRPEVKTDSKSDSRAEALEVEAPIEAKVEAKAEPEVEAQPEKAEPRVPARVAAKAEPKVAAKLGLEEEAEAPVAPKRTPKSGLKRVERAEGRSKVLAARTPGATATVDVAEGPFDPPCRLERGDVWRAFGFGLSPSRIGIALSSLTGAIVVSGALLGVGALAAKLTVILAIPFALLAALATAVALAVGRGALAYDARRRLEERDPPTIREALGVALKDGPAHLLPPIVLGLLWLVPAIGLIVLSFGLKIPFVGPVATGLLFCVHLALGAAALYLLVVGASSTAFGPVVAAFEGHGLVGTVRALVAWPRQGLFRALIASALPAMAFGPFALVVLLLGAVGLALPLLPVGAQVGQDVVAWARSYADAEPVALPSGLGIGLVPLTFWVAVFVAAVLSVLASVSNAITAAAYAVGRPGNEARVSRDTWLARRAAAAEGAIGSAVGSAIGSGFGSQAGK
jgi:hypothetical protein